MATLVVLPPIFKLQGSQKEPPRITRPIGPGALFLDRDFVVLGIAPGPPQFNTTFINPPTSISAVMANAGGTIAAGTYQVAIGYVNAAGTTPVGPVQSLTTTGTGLLTVQSPPASGDATGYRLYVSAAGGQPLFLQGSTVAIGTAATLSAPPSTATPAPTTNTTGLAAPTIPSLSAGGTTSLLGARTEFVIVTYVNANGETTGSPEASQALTSGQLLTVTSPAASGDATGYNVYVGFVSGQEARQTATPIALGTNWTEPTSGPVTQGVQRAVANQPGTINGFAAILGVADHDSNAIYGQYVGGAQSGGLTPFGRPVWNVRVLGATGQYPMIATEPQNAHIIAASKVQFEIALKQAWDPALAGELGGLAIDPTSGFFIFDLTATNQIAQLQEPVDGVGFGVPGDINKRVAISILPQFCAA